MSIVALKRKTATKYGKLSSRGSEGFSLNNPRRVDSHHNQVQTQTPMKGNRTIPPKLDAGYKIHCMK